MARCRREKKRGVLATIIRVEGSSYQKEGTKCFFAEDGALIGLLSGGCVESDVIEHGKEVLEEGKPKTIYYDFRDEDDQVWGLGVGCNGAIEIFLELYDPQQYPEKSMLMEKTLVAEIPQIIATVVKAEEESRLGKKWIVASDDEFLSFVLSDKDKNVHHRKTKSRLVTLADDTELFIDFIEPIPTLIIFGAGPDAVPLVKLTKEMGWRVKVVDHRPGFVNPSIFPLADELICYPRDQVPELTLHDNTYTVVMSHNFNQDQIVLETLVQSTVPYIGVLGPSRRTNQLLEPLLSNYKSETLNLERIYSPVGIDIHAKTPEEIALSITSELINVYRGGRSLHLKQTKGHTQTNQEQTWERGCSLSL